VNNLVVEAGFFQLTLIYTAPELSASKNTHEFITIDVYAVGLICYEILIGVKAL
jgi:hypothetical protein